MKFHMPSAEIFIPDGISIDQALARTTHICFAAHQDDIEIMAAAPILESFQNNDHWFTAVILTDGRGSPRSGIYEKYSDEEMRLVRFKEQRKAAITGEYAALIQLDYPSKIVKDKNNDSPIKDIIKILEMTQPRFIYTHNLADKHATHVATAIRLIQAIRSMGPRWQPARLLGCEVWRSLDWMNDDEKVILDCSHQENLQTALLGIFDSQISGGKRYDLATMGRRIANATYYASHDVDESNGMNYAMDLTPLIQNPELDILKYTKDFIHRFSNEVESLLTGLL